MNTNIQSAPVYEGAFLGLPDGAVSRGVFDQMGVHMVHVEYSMTEPAHSYRVRAQLSGPVPDGAVYLGAVAESFGQRVIHYYAVPQ